MSFGVIYVATGKSYIDEACQSAASLKDKMPNTKITIFSSQMVKSPFFDEVVIIRKPQYDYVDKILPIANSPYKHTLFLDTDTYLCDDISEIFTLLERFDIAVAHEPWRREGINYEAIGDEIPPSFPEMNTGVILFKKSPKVSLLFREWLKIYQASMSKKVKPRHDQPAFREALFKSELRVATLTPEYNCRFIFPVFVGGLAEVKILHGRYPELSAVAKELNSKKEARVFTKWSISDASRYSDRVAPLLELTH